MTTIRYTVSMLFVALLGASAAVVGQSVAADKASEVPLANCVTTFDYDAMSQQERDRLFPESK